MRKDTITGITRAFLVGVVFLALSTVVSAQSSGNIDSTDKWAWGTNVGWINFRPDHGGAAVYVDHLEGYVWMENVGWTRLGTYTGGGSHTYINASFDNYGVNNDGTGKLAGFAWSTTSGWINFDPAGSEQVTIDPATGSFDGFAWAENLGWIHFKNSAPSSSYSVVTSGEVPVKLQSLTVE